MWRCGGQKSQVVFGMSAAGDAMQRTSRKSLALAAASRKSPVLPGMNAKSYVYIFHKVRKLTVTATTSITMTIPTTRCTTRATHDDNDKACSKSHAPTNMFKTKVTTPSYKQEAQQQQQQRQQQRRRQRQRQRQQ